jgi:hypothetical protein
MVYFPKAPRALGFLEGLQSEPDTGGAQIHIGANLLFKLCVRENRKSF